MEGPRDPGRSANTYGTRTRRTRNRRRSRGKRGQRKRKKTEIDRKNARDEWEREEEE